MALLDDAAGRRACRQLDIPVMGFAGILLFEHDFGSAFAFN
jgi:predicted nucleic acid-binding protein